MASPATKPPALPTSEPATVLERLLRDREQAADSVKRLTGVSARLNTEADGDAALLAELAKLSETETVEMRKWADGGCQGVAPKGKQVERQAIATKLAASKATADAARRAIADADAQIGQLDDRLHAIGAQIEKAALDAMQDELADIRSEHLAAIERARKSSARIFGLCSFFSNEGRRLIDNGDHEAGKRYLARAEVMTAIKLPQPSLSHGEIIEAANDWSRRAATLRSGK